MWADELCFYDLFELREFECLTLLCFRSTSRRRRLSQSPSAPPRHITRTRMLSHRQHGTYNTPTASTGTSRGAVERVQSRAGAGGNQFVPHTTQPFERRSDEHQSHYTPQYAQPLQHSAATVAPGAATAGAPASTCVAAAVAGVLVLCQQHANLCGVRERFARRLRNGQRERRGAAKMVRVPECSVQLCSSLACNLWIKAPTPNPKAPLARRACRVAALHRATARLCDCSMNAFTVSSSSQYIKMNF